MEGDSILVVVMPYGHAWAAVATSRKRWANRPGGIATLAVLRMELLKGSIKEAR